MRSEGFWKSLVISGLLSPGGTPLLVPKNCGRFARKSIRPKALRPDVSRFARWQTTRNRLQHGLSVMSSSWNWISFLRLPEKVPAIWTSHIRDTEWMFIKMKSAGSSAIAISIFETFRVKFSLEQGVDQLSFHSYALFSGLKTGK